MAKSRKPREERPADLLPLPAERTPPRTRKEAHAKQLAEAGPTPGQIARAKKSIFATHTTENGVVMRSVSRFNNPDSVRVDIAGDGLIVYVDGERVFSVVGAGNIVVDEST